MKTKTALAEHFPQAQFFCCDLPLFGAGLAVMGICGLSGQAFCIFHSP